MTEALQQMALVDMLLVNWSNLRLQIGPMEEAQAAEFISLGKKLSDTQSISEVAELLDKLFDLVRTTAGATYLRELIARASLTDQFKTRGPAVLRAVPSAHDLLESPQRAFESAWNFGSQVSSVSLPIGVKPVPIFFATNRQAAGASATTFLGVTGARLSYGLATVSVPTAHHIGKLEQPKLWNKADPQKYILLQNVESLNQSAFMTRLGADTLAAKSSEVLIFVHGFNVTFEEAALRAAQFKEDSSFEGIVVLYSWPSQGFIRDYLADEDRSSASGDSMAELLRQLENGPWQKVHFLAHSMGSRVMLSGLADNPRPKLPLSQLVFAAADVSVDVFNQKFPKLQAAGRLPTTSYVSAKDHALWLSSFLHGGPRVGKIDNIPYCIDHLDSIDATTVSNGILGHGYWSDQRPLLSDLLALLSQGRSPDKRGLRSVGPYWEFPQ